MPEPRAILAFGDSLTWGRDPADGTRHALADRWTSVLETGLRGSARVIVEGLSGRTTCFDDPSGAVDRNGARILPVLLASHAPLDLVIIMLGANDLKPAICGTAEGVAEGIARLVALVRMPLPATPVLIVSPPCFGPTMRPDGQPARGRSIAQSQRLAGMLWNVATRQDCAFFDAASVAHACRQDGVHLDAANTRAIGTALAPIVQTLIA